MRTCVSKGMITDWDGGVTAGVQEMLRRVDVLLEN